MARYVPHRPHGNTPAPATDLRSYCDSQNIADDEPPAYTSPNANYQTPAVGASSKANDTSPIPPPDFQEKPKRESSTRQTADVPTTSASSSVDELKSQLSEAKTQIQNLKDRLADQGLRQRKIGGETEKSGGAVVQQQQTQSAEAGVPVQIVAGLCLLSFLIAYFLF
jgi:hypothetical protein